MNLKDLVPDQASKYSSFLFSFFCVVGWPFFPLSLQTSYDLSYSVCFIDVLLSKIGREAVSCQHCKGELSEFLYSLFFLKTMPYIPIHNFHAIYDLLLERFEHCDF